ncbi:glutathione hydrolase-like YwrD proenzyme [Nephila pilipes]|uniref:Glutathione hydrolase-like YwrD proenzyme n=1 Tax=Nephila pilipes TaxID=299642 RepID=A0A8X6TY90_NEPPI|nr:glutathione hydrolase-like YwrD proenzyme [Nephila pilipes]
MSIEEDSTNVFGPNKLPLHSIIPAIVTEVATGDLMAVLGHVGRWMQPQGHLQVEYLSLRSYSLKINTSISLLAVFSSTLLMISKGLCLFRFVALELLFDYLPTLIGTFI